MRAALVTYGTEGDTRPMLALARGLVAAGHSAVVVSDQALTATATRYGIEFVPLDGDLKRRMSEDELGRYIRGGGGTAAGMGLVGRLYEELMAPWHRVAAEAAAGADLVTYSGLALAPGRSAAELHGVPGVAALLQPMLGTREFVPSLDLVVPAPLRKPLFEVTGRLFWQAVRPSINAGRAAIGLPARRRMWRTRPAICGWSSWLLPKPVDWPCDVTVTGDWPLVDEDVEPPADLVAWLSSGERPVYVGLGSMGLDPGLVRIVVAGLDGRRAILSAGWGDLTGVDVPDTVRIVGHLPHRWLFTQVTAAVHHCGAGTAHSALRAGIPTIPMPMTADQPFWARRLRLKGVATPPLDARHVTVAAVAKAVERAHREPIAQRARGAARRLGAERGVEQAVVSLERWAERGPVQFD